MKIIKSEWGYGQTINFRNASIKDAKFILSLRLDDKKSRFLSETSESIENQLIWLEKYADSDDQAYFIIEDKTGDKIGTVRLYDPRGSSFCWGSWIIKGGVSPFVAIESALMVYHYAIDFMGFDSSHFDVRKDNESVWKFHEKFGATRIGETEEDFIYEITKESIFRSLKRYHKFLKRGVLVSDQGNVSTRLVRFSSLGDSRGSLISLEQGKNIPFEIKRVYYLYGTKEGVARGFHAHKALKQIAICVSGSCRFVLDDGMGKEEVMLGSPDQGLLIEGMVWREMYGFSEDCVLMVLANEHYDEVDYIRDYKEFMMMVESNAS